MLDALPRFYKSFTHCSLFPFLTKAILKSDKRKGGNRMDFHWDASADLEDLIYENQDVSASER